MNVFLCAYLPDENRDLILLLPSLACVVAHYASKDLLNVVRETSSGFQTCRNKLRTLPLPENKGHQNFGSDRGSLKDNSMLFLFIFVALSEERV